MIKQKIKNFIILIAIVIPLLCGITVFAVDDNLDDIEILTKTPVTGIAEDVPTSNIKLSKEDEVIKDIDDIPDNDRFKKSTPNVLLKFFIAIAWVIMSSLIIYFSLVSYKKLSGKPKFGIDVEENTLETPKNFKEAINLFIKKTRD
ncbi:hypothetical protein IJ818_08185 [bacterium]|nr:hypothetical protein [bacterium]